MLNAARFWNGKRQRWWKGDVCVKKNNNNNNNGWLGREAKKRKTDKVGLVLSPCHEEGGWECLCSKTERHPCILQPATVHQVLKTTVLHSFLNKTLELLYLVPRLSSRCRHEKGLCFISAFLNMALHTNKCVWSPQAALSHAIIFPSIYRWLPSASLRGLQLSRGVYFYIHTI